MFLAQLRQMRLAERSGEASVKDQKNMLFPAKAGQAYRISLIIQHGELWCRCIYNNFCHVDTPTERLIPGKYNLLFIYCQDFVYVI